MANSIAVIEIFTTEGIEEHRGGSY